MESDQGSDLPCKKLRTMFVAMEAEASKEEAESCRDQTVHPEMGTVMEMMGPDGDMNRDHTRGQGCSSSIDMEPGLSGDSQHYSLSKLDGQGCIKSDSTSNDNAIGPQPDDDDADRTFEPGESTITAGCVTERPLGNRHPVRNETSAERFSFLQTSAAIAENAYIKSKENEKLSGESVGMRYGVTSTRTDRAFPVTSTSTAMSSSQETGEESNNLAAENESTDSDKIIAFDRADFEFDFYGASTRQEDDGSLITPPERMADSGFIEMFSNSVMSSLLCSQGSEPSRSTVVKPAGSGQMTDYPGTCSKRRVFKPVKKWNIPFQLSYEYMNDTCGQQNINSLPQTLLVHIFKSLSPYTLLRGASCVCKYWYNVSRDPDLWREINLRNQYKLVDVALVQLLGFSDRVLKVNLTDCRNVTDSGIRRLILKCPHLQSLKLMRCFDLTDLSFEGILSWRLGSNLHTLHLDGCCRLSDNTVTEIAEACPHISSLHLNQCTRISDVGILALAQHCHGLKQLLLDHCGKVTDKGLTELVLGCPNITYLNIMSCGVTDTGIKTLSKLSNLANLDVSNIPLMTPIAIEYVSRYCKKLDCINVSLNSVIDDNCVAEVVKNLPGLLRFYCVSCSVTDKGLEKIAEYRPTLEALDVGWCQDVTDQGVRVISHACRKLDYFGLIRCDKVTIETIEELVLKFPTVNYSTFILESRRLLERARKEGYQFSL